MPSTFGSFRQASLYSFQAVLESLSRLQHSLHIYISRSPKQVSINKRVLNNQLKFCSDKIAKSFDKHFSAEMEEISIQLANILEIQLSSIQHLRETTELQRAIYPLLQNAWNSIVSTIILLRSGYRLQPGILLRSIIEAISTAVYLTLDSSQVPQFTSGNLESQKTLSEAKKALPGIGRLYGVLSDDFAHMGQLHRSLISVDYYEESDPGATETLSLVRISIWMLYVASELAFFDFIEPKRYWRKVRANQFEFNPTDKEKLWMEVFLRHPVPNN